MKYYKSMSRDDRLSEIFVVLAHSGVAMTMTDISRQIGMSPSSHLMGLLYELVSEGDVVLLQEPYRNGLRNLFKARNYSGE